MTAQTAAALKKALAAHGNADDAVFLQRFFKTGKGQYGEGDQFIGVRVPATRQVCKTFRGLPLSEVAKLLDSPVHEHRLAGAIILANDYAKAAPDIQRQIFELYLRKVYEGKINNWDIVDTTAEYVIGAHLEKSDRKLLYSLAKSSDLWQKRVAIMSTFGYIKRGDPGTTLDIVDILLYDPEDLVQKAVGWMLREIGKRVDPKILEDFLDTHAHDMPRTALRYALEKLSPRQKAHYMAAKNGS